MILLLSIAILISLCAIIRPFRPFKSRGIAFLSLIIFVAIVGIVVSAAANQSPSTRTVATTTAAAVSSPALTQPMADAATKRVNWIYSESTDEMTGTVNKTACTESTNELDFSFPYNGGSSGSLCFRRKGKALNAWIRVSKGQFVCGIEDCTLRLKFDEGAIQTYRGLESESQSTGLLFLQPEAKLLKASVGAKKLKLQAIYYQEGQQVLNFDLDGLDIKRI